MEILLGIVAAAIVLFSLGMAGRASAAEKPPVAMTQLATRTPAQVAPDALRERLEKLAESAAPKKLSPGAMCYDMAMPPDRFDYVCPACKTKTVHARGKEEAPIQWELDACRRALKTIKDLDIKLTETGFCAKCDPDAKKPVLGIRIRYAGDKTHTVAPVTSVDLQLIAEFMAGKDKHDGGQAGEKPLRDYAKRLAELLGTGPLKK
jgi:hypothetical protein